MADSWLLRPWSQKGLGQPALSHVPGISAAAGTMNPSEPQCYPPQYGDQSVSIVMQGRGFDGTAQSLTPSRCLVTMYVPTITTSPSPFPLFSRPSSDLLSFPQSTARPIGLQTSRVVGFHPWASEHRVWTSPLCPRKQALSRSPPSKQPRDWGFLEKLGRESLEGGQMQRGPRRG